MDSLTILIIIICGLVWWRAEAAISAFYRVQAAETSVMFQIDEAKDEISKYVKTKERGIEGRIVSNITADINSIKEEILNRQDRQTEARGKELTALESSIKAEMSDISNSITSHNQHIKAVDERQDEILESLNQNVIPFMNELQDRITAIEAAQGPGADTEEAPTLISCPICDGRTFNSIKALIGHCARLNDPEHMALIDELKSQP